MEKNTSWKGQSGIRARGPEITRLEALLSQFPTKGDVAALRADMEILRRDLTIRLGSMIVVATGILLAAKFFS